MPFVALRRPRYCWPFTVERLEVVCRGEALVGELAVFRRQSHLSVEAQAQQEEQTKRKHRLRKHGASSHLQGADQASPFDVVDG